MKDSITAVIHKPWFLPAVVGVASFGGGFTAGYFYGRKKGVDDFLDAVNDNWVIPDNSNDVDPATFIQDVEEDVYSPETTAELAENIQQYEELVVTSNYNRVDYTSPEVIDDDETSEPGVIEDETVIEHSSPTVRVNVFDSDAEDWDYDKEIVKREENNDFPYVIHVDEYTRNDLGFRQETLTYYQQDDVLADVNDNAIHNWPKLTGELTFGYGSGSPNVVYIRNEPLRHEWEILLHTGSYTAEVHGLHLEEEWEASDLKHSASPRKFRQEA